MIVPGQISGLDLNPSGGGTNPMANPGQAPTDQHLLMAAATMQKLGRLGGKSDAMTPKAPSKRKPRVI